jgi:acyl transferase domain-containing protein
MTGPALTSNAVAVIGMSCRLPGARNLDEFWRNLDAGVESIVAFSDAELLQAGVDRALIDHPSYVKAGSILDDVELFDASLFGIGAREAEILDVQHRVFLECAWSALENAACDPERHRGPIGVYAGAGLNAYLLNNLLPNRALLASLGEYQAMLANDKDYLPTRVSYKLNLRGPSLSVQTACSTSLVAVHLACQSLLSGECDMALAGGVSVRVPQKTGYLYNEGMILSPDGHCRAFDRRAAGTIGGSGCGVVVLKRIDDAIAARDDIQAVVLGSAVNNDGAVKVGYTAPSVDGQRAVIAEAIAVAGARPETISFVEAHGTGTALGDPVEFAALCEVFRTATAAPAWCTLGAVKTNIGHLDAAAGIAGFIKTVLALRHRRIPPTLHFTEPNPQLGLATSPFRINTVAEPWLSDGGPRRAGVSSFGIGGTNAHVVLEEAPEVPVAPVARTSRLFVVSARSERGLADARGDLARALRDDGDRDLDDVAFTLQAGRRAYPYRAAVVASGREQACAALERRDRHDIAGDQRPVIFMFPGQGAQYAGMGAGLYRVESVFRQVIDDCAAFLAPPLGIDIRDLLLASGDAAAAEQLTDTRVAQPAIFAIEYALARQLEAWGIVPSESIGHSVGEYAAACVAGAIDPYDALTLLAERGRLIASLPPGRMTAVRCPADRLQPMLNGDVTIAAINAPQACVISGPSAAVLETERRCLALNIECQALKTSHAFHSAMMDPILDRFGAVAASLRIEPRSRRWISNLTGSWIDAGEAAGPTYWTRHLRETVQFSSGLGRVLGDGAPILVEVGPGRALSALALEHAGADRAVIVSAMRHARDDTPDDEVVLRAVGRLWMAGAPVAWEAFDANRGRRRVSLPPRPFERQRFWIDPPASKPDGVGAPAHVGAVRRPIDDWFSTPSWKRAPMPEAGERSFDAPWLWLGPTGDPAIAPVLQELENRGARVIVVEPAERYAQVSKQHYQIRAANPDDHQRVFAALRACDAAPQTVVHAWSPIDDPNGRTPSPGTDAFLSLLWLARVLAEEPPGERRLLVLSPRRDAADRLRAEVERALTLGAVRAIARELPSVRCRAIEFEPSNAIVSAPAVRVLASELAANPADEPLVAYRENQRHVEWLAPVTLPAGRAAFRAGAHYLITGGTGGIGLVFAGHLARRYRARLTLLGRSRVPDAAAIRAMEQGGGRVEVVSADVADLEQLRAAVRVAESRFGGVTGVIHAAGVPAGGVIARKTAADVDATLRPKVHGALNLAAIFGERTLECFVLMSSLGAIVGDVGQVDYCAANAGLDALAHALRRDGRSVCAIDWDTWSESGMAASAQLPAPLQALHAERLKHGIGDAEGTEALERIVASGMTQVIVATRDLRVHRAGDGAPAAVSHGSAANAAALHPRPELDVAFVAPEAPLEQAIAGAWQSLLGIEPIGVHDDFFALGGHSLVATELLSRLRDQIGGRVTLATFFDNPTIAGLVRAFEARQLEAVLADIDRLSEAEAERMLFDDDHSLS